MKLEQCGELDEIFTHEDPDAGVIRHFNATQLGEYAYTHKEIARVKIALDPEHAKYIITNRGIEQPKLDRLCDPWIHKPVIGVEFSDGQTLMVDGHHRYVKRHQLGFDEISAYHFKPGQWEAFLIEDMPQSINLENLGKVEKMLRERGLIPSV